MNTTEITRDEMIANLRKAMEDLRGELVKCDTAEMRAIVENEIRETRRYLIQVAR
jgi:hypothetical protein